MLLAERANDDTSRKSLPIDALALFSFGSTSQPDSTCHRMSHDLLALVSNTSTILERSPSGRKTRNAGMWIKTVKIEVKTHLQIK